MDWRTVFYWGWWIASAPCSVHNSEDGEFTNVLTANRARKNTWFPSLPLLHPLKDNSNCRSSGMHLWLKLIDSLNMNSVLTATDVCCADANFSHCNIYTQSRALFHSNFFVLPETCPKQRWAFLDNGRSSRPVCRTE